MFDPGNTRGLCGAALAQALRESRAHTWALVDDLSDAQWQVPELPGVNPIAWELGHLAWFAEFWVLRGPHAVDGDGTTVAQRAPRHAGPDARFDSSRIAHAARWRMAMPSRAELVDMLGAQLEACIAALPDGDDDGALYLHRLALFHEDMHAEAFTWLRAALGLPAPLSFDGPRLNPLPEEAGRLTRVLGGSVQIGSPSACSGFAFDNEQPGHTVTLADYEIDTAPLTTGAFLRFVEAGGYDAPAHWPGAAGVWRAASGRRHPQRWRIDPSVSSPSTWQTCWFGRWQPLVVEAPLITSTPSRPRPIAAGPGGACRVLPNGSTPRRNSNGAPASGSGRPMRSSPTPASRPGRTANTPRPGSAIIASCAAHRSRPRRACSTLATATFSNRIALMCSRASAPPHCADLCCTTCSSPKPKA